jgi:hypothetical protein
VESKSCGREEIGHLLNFPAESFSQGFGGPAVPASLPPESAGSSFEAIGFVPQGTACNVEGCNTNAHLNGKVGILSVPCLDGQEYAKVNLGDLGDLQLHRKNLRLPGVSKPSEQDKDRSKNEDRPKKECVTDDPQVEFVDIGSWWPFNIFCSGARSCCKGGKNEPLAVVQDDFQNYATHDCDMVQSDVKAIHPSFGPDKAGNNRGGVFCADDLRKIATMKAAGDITETDFQILKDRILKGEEADVSSKITEGLQKLSQFKKGDEVTTTQYEAAKQKLFNSPSQGNSVLEELSKLVSLKAEGFLSHTEFAMSKMRLLGP